MPENASTHILKAHKNMPWNIQYGCNLLNILHR